MFRCYARERDNFMIIYLKLIFFLIVTYLRFLFRFYIHVINYSFLLHSDFFALDCARHACSPHEALPSLLIQVRIAKPQMTHNPDSLETALPKANATVIVTFAFLQTYPYRVSRVRMRWVTRYTLCMCDLSTYNIARLITCA